MATALYGLGVYGVDVYDEILVVENPPVHVREKPPLRQHIDAITPSGRHYRWGEDEPDAANVFADLRHSSTMPGGYESLEVTLPRKPGVDYSDLERLTTLRVIGAGGQVDGEYRLERAPRVSGDQMAISPSAVGWQAHLEDDKSAREIYVDRDISHFTEPPTTQRQLGLEDIGGIAYKLSGSTDATSDDAGNPAVIQRQDRIEASATARTLTESWYNARGIPLSGVYYDLSTFDRGTGGIITSTDWVVGVTLSADDTGGVSFDTVDEADGSAQNAAYFTTTSTDRVYAVLNFYFAGTFTGDTDVRAYWRKLTAYGRHGLTGRGDHPQGLYASDVVAHAVRRWAPLLQIKSDSVQQSSFVVPHLVFLEPTTAAEIVRQASRFNLPDWAVWDDREFVWHERGTRGRRWRARIGPSQLEETGPQLDRLWNGIIVSYQDVDGTTRTVGPVGSGSDTESSDLSDLDPENPANKLGIRRWDVLQMGVSTAAGATEVGRRFLEQTKVLDSSGRATIVGWVEDDRGVMHPYTRVRAGDSISFTDASDSGYRRVVRADHSRSSRSCSIDLDAPPDGLAQVLERLGVVLVSLGVG